MSSESILTSPTSEESTSMSSGSDSSADASLVSIGFPEESNFLPKITKNWSSRIKRPMNSFLIWSKKRRQEIAADRGGQKPIRNSDVSKLLGAEWQKMTNEEKAPFVQKSRELQAEFFREHPDYVYRPRRRKKKTSLPMVPPQTGSTNQPPVNNNSLLMSMLLTNCMYNNRFTQLNAIPQNINFYGTAPATYPNIFGVP